MNIQELIEIIKKEKLYKYCDFQIGPPDDISNIGTFTHGAPAYGIFEERPGIWKDYILGERGTAKVTDNELTESAACTELLETLRRKKELSRLHGNIFGRTGYHIQNKAKWFN